MTFHEPACSLCNEVFKSPVYYQCSRCWINVCDKCWSTHKKVHFVQQLTIGGRPLISGISETAQANVSEPGPEQLQLDFDS